jgi:hypothetical protein
MDNDSSISCSECKFYFSFGDGESDGECRKNPPVIHFIGEDAFYSSKTVFPVVNDLLWCGSFMRSYSNKDEEETPYIDALANGISEQSLKGSKNVSDQEREKRQSIPHERIGW